MAWSGYLTWAGVEMINTARTEHYARDAGWFKPVYKGDLAAVLGHEYHQPVQDSAPWLDEYTPATAAFWGCYPLNITGLEDSTATAVVTESILDGGVVGSQRRSTRTVVFNLVLVGAHEAAVQAGFGWLKTVVSNRSPGDCGRSCNGDTLCFLASQPCVDPDGCPPGGDPTDCYLPLARSLNGVTVILGPTVTAKRTMVDGGAAWLVSMTAVAADPYVYGDQTDLIRGFMGLSTDPTATPYIFGTPPGGGWDADGTPQQDVECHERTWQPLADPLCASVIAPPLIPGVPLSCFDFPVNYTRRWVTIPSQFLPTWRDVVPRFVLRTGDEEVRPLRLRLYLTSPPEVPETDPAHLLDPCNYCADLVVSYIPANAEFVIDGVTRTIYATVDGGPNRRADALVFGSAGVPFEWPLLACGYPYTVAVDMTNTQVPPTLDVSLYTRIP